MYNYPIPFSLMMSILLGFVLSQMPSRNARTQTRVVCCIRFTAL